MTWAFSHGYAVLLIRRLAGQHEDAARGRVKIWGTMIPRSEDSSSCDLPVEATFWMPSEEEIPEDEGIGYFRGVWMILGVTAEEASSMVVLESDQIEVIADLAETPALFEQVASACDTGLVEGVRDEGLRHQLLQRIPSLSEETDDYYADLGGLEVGVAALSHALSYVGGVPVASCRGHISEHRWADLPVVYAALDRQRAEWLQPLLRETGCGFHVDPERPEFLVIDAPSIIESNALAKLIVDRFDGKSLFGTWLDLPDAWL
ncbi:hypothetical protein [Streptomyces sp. NPDC050564]|uniref:hypothetical protein n=1 Tax=Streptomyces sp. NPDC050564 TaxID=3365631 RepID=UPI0037AB37A1